MIRQMKKKPHSDLSKADVEKKWTSGYGLDNLYVKGAAEAETNIVNRVVDSCTGKVCEVGCGDGRIAEHFLPERYLGVDISELAINKAKKRCVHHDFKVLGYDDVYPDADTFVFYTVLLHVPDDVLKSVFDRAKVAGAKRIVIYEVMIGWIRDYARHDNFHRSPSDFVKASGMKETALYFVKSQFFPWCGNILILDI